MSTDNCMDLLLEEAEKRCLSLDGKPDPTAADVAVQVFLQDRRLLERKHAGAVSHPAALLRVLPDRSAAGPRVQTTFTWKR